MIPIRRMAAGGGARTEAAVRAFKTHSRCADSLAAFLSDPASSLLAAEAEDEPVGSLLAYRLQRPDRPARTGAVVEDDAAVLFVYPIAFEGAA